MQRNSAGAVETNSLPGKGNYPFEVTAGTATGVARVVFCV